jgi:ABC-type bacteriocin/lantibiotic exporter with double-glycine peptidase domain
LAFVARAVGVEVRRDRLRQALREAPGEGAASLVEAAAEVGVAARTVRRSLRLLAEETHARGPALIESPAGWVALCGAEGGRARVVRFAPVEQPADEPIGELARSLGVGLDEEVGWLLATTALPLEGLRGHGDHPPPLRRLLALFRPDRGDLGVVLLYAAAVGLLSLAVPVAVQALVNTVAFGVLRQPLVVLTLLVLLGLGFAGALRAAQTFVVELLQRRLFVRAAIDAAWRLPRAGRGAFDRVHGPELATRFFDVLTLQKSAATLLLDGVGVALQVGIGALLLAFYHPALLAFDVGLLAAIAVIALGPGRRALATSVAESQAKYGVAAWVAELSRHGTAFRAVPGRRLALERMEGLVAAYLQARSSHFRVVLRQVVAFLALHALASALLLGIGAFLVIERQLTLGQLVAAELVVSAVLEGVSKSGKYLETWYDLLAAADKLGYLVDLPLEREGGEGLGDQRPIEVELRGVSLAPLESGGPEPLRGVSLRIERGERVAITGPAGAGKTLLGEVIAGVREPGGGRLQIEGIDLRELGLGRLRERVVLVQGPEIFEGTVAENLRLGRDDLPASRLREALGQAGLLEGVGALPHGLDEPLTTGGAPLTSEQASRLALARAFLAAPSLLVLDGVLDRLDPGPRGPLLDVLVAPGAPWTLAVVSHDPEVIARCQRRIELREGQIAPVRRAA